MLKSRLTKCRPVHVGAIVCNSIARCVTFKKRNSTVCKLGLRSPAYSLPHLVCCVVCMVWCADCVDWLLVAWIGSVVVWLCGSVVVWIGSVVAGSVGTRLTPHLPHPLISTALQIQNLTPHYIEHIIPESRVAVRRNICKRNI